MKLVFSFIIAASFALFSPAQAKDSDGPGPEDARYAKIILWANGFEDKDREEIERDTIKTFTKKGVQAQAMLDVLSEPGRYTGKQVAEKAKESGAQAIFQIVPLDRSGKGPMGIPGMDFENRGFEGMGIYVSQGGPGISGANRSSGGDVVFTRTTNGNRRHLPSGTFRVNLINLDTGEVIWTDDVKTEGHEKAKFEYLAEKAFRKGARKALKSGWLAPEESE